MARACAQMEADAAAAGLHQLRQVSQAQPVKQETQSKRVKMCGTVVTTIEFTKDTLQVSQRRCKMDTREHGLLHHGALRSYNKSGFWI